MAELDVTPAIATRREEAVGWLGRMVSKGLGWARKYSLFTYPFATACCGMEYMSVAASRYDIARFGAEFPRFSPRQADLLMVIGTINMKQAPILKRVYGRVLRQLRGAAGDRPDHPGGRVYPRVPAAAGAGAGWVDAPAGQDHQA